MFKYYNAIINVSNKYKRKLTKRLKNKANRIFKKVFNFFFSTEINMLVVVRKKRKIVKINTISDDKNTVISYPPKSTI